MELFFFLFFILLPLRVFIIFFLGFNPHETTLIQPIIPVLLFARNSDPFDPSYVGTIFSHAIYHSALKFEAPGSAETTAMPPRKAV